uniref:VanZ family protein n=1 Tax=Roseivirga sp. TaxID=1964215 RepID=UPI004047ABAA
MARSFIKSYWTSVLWGMMLAVLMLAPQDAFPESELLGYDKLAHLGVFAIFSITILFGNKLRHHKKKLDNQKKLNAFFISVVYGIVLESLQYFVPGRMVDIYDLLANTVGAIVGVILFSTFNKN